MNIHKREWDHETQRLWNYKAWLEVRYGEDSITMTMKHSYHQTWKGVSITTIVILLKSVAILIDNLEIFIDNIYDRCVPVGWLHHKRMDNDFRSLHKWMKLRKALYHRNVRDWWPHGSPKSAARYVRCKNSFVCGQVKGWIWLGFSCERRWKVSKKSWLDSLQVMSEKYSC